MDHKREHRTPPLARVMGVGRQQQQDPLTVTKLEFFISVAKQLQPFLLKFQTDAPMAPFLGQSLKDLLLTLMGRFTKKYVLEQTDSYPKLAALEACGVWLCSPAVTEICNGQ